MSDPKPSFEVEGFTGALTEKECFEALTMWNEDCLPLHPFVHAYGISYERIDISFSERHWEIVKFIVGGFLQSDLLLYIPEFGVWDSANAYPTFQFVRQANGEFRTVGDCPGEVLNPKSEYALSLIHTALISDWDVCLASPLPHCMWYFSHDGWLKFLSDDPATDWTVRERFGTPRNEWPDPLKGL